VSKPVVGGFGTNVSVEYFYYPSGWTEQIHDEYYIEWVYDDDPSIFVRLDGTMGDGYSVTPITGVNSNGEEFVTRPMSNRSKEEFEVAQTLIYAINGDWSNIW
jgi:hypothetical protein